MSSDVESLKSGPTRNEDDILPVLDLRKMGSPLQRETQLSVERTNTVSMMTPPIRVKPSVKLPGVYRTLSYVSPFRVQRLLTFVKGFTFPSPKIIVDITARPLRRKT